MDSRDNQSSKGDPEALKPVESAPGATAPRDPWSMPPPMQLPDFLRSRGVPPRGRAPSEAKVYGMTRRFSMRATMLLMALAAVCLAILRSVGTPAETSGIVLLVMIAAAAAQVFMFRGKDPRRASMAGGAVAMSVLLTAAQIVEEGRRLNFGRGLRDVILGLVFGSIVGAIVGYMTGALVAGVFLLIDKYDEWRPKKAPPAENIDPLADD